MLEDYTRTTTLMVLDVLRLLRPQTLAGSQKVRLGRFFDGGYVMVDHFENVEAAYSLGINDDVSWDMDIARRGIPVYQYDHTITALPEQHALFHWEPKCISGLLDENRPEVETLDRLMRRNKHESASNLLLKCDIEGAEWLLLDRTPNSLLAKFSQIVIELHNLAFLSTQSDGNNVRRAIQNLTSSHHVVHVHANNFAGWEIVGGIPVPHVLELTLVRRDLGSFAPSSEVFPTTIDMPCYSERADLFLGTFAY